MLRRTFPLRPWPRQPPARRVFRPARHSSSQSTPPRASRIDRITSKLPKRLQPYTRRLRDAPGSHIVSFIILHELTAIVPLVALFAVLHYTALVPVSYVAENFGEGIQSGLTMFERYFRRKGWFGFETEEPAAVERLSDSPDKSPKEIVMEHWRQGDHKYEILMEVALAYAITKALLPLRIVGSVWATPWFASVLVRLRGAWTRKP